MKIFVVVGMVFLILLSANKSDGHESPSLHVLNVIVILDTSNRVSRDRHPDQIERDIEIEREIVTRFEAVVKKHIDDSDDLAYDDSLTIVVPGQLTVPHPWRIVQRLRIKDPGDCNNYNGCLEQLTQQKNALLKEMSQLYEFVNQHPQTGSDIYEWFEFEAKDYFDEDKRNLIICLSDGYLNFDKSIEARREDGTHMKIRELRDDPNWKERILNGEGLKPIGEDFSPYNVKFLMLEIVPQNQKDFKIIKTYWDTWLNSMGIEDSDFRKKTGLPIETIKSFISAESEQE